MSVTLNKKGLCDMEDLNGLDRTNEVYKQLDNFERPGSSHNHNE